MTFPNHSYNITPNGHLNHGTFNHYNSCYQHPPSPSSSPSYTTPPPTSSSPAPSLSTHHPLYQNTTPKSPSSPSPPRSPPSPQTSSADLSLCSSMGPLHAQRFHSCPHISPHWYLCRCIPNSVSGAGSDGRNEPFALPFPVVRGVRHEVACEWVGRRAFEFEFVFFWDVVVIGGHGDVELE